MAVIHESPAYRRSERIRRELRHDEAVGVYLVGRTGRSPSCGTRCGWPVQVSEWKWLEGGEAVDGSGWVTSRSRGSFQEASSPSACLSDDSPWVSDFRLNSSQPCEEGVNELRRAAGCRRDYQCGGD